MHLGQLELSFGSGSGWESCVSYYVSESLSVAVHQDIRNNIFDRVAFAIDCGITHLSGSFSAKTLRLVWSRMVLMLTKHPRSSFFALNIDMLAAIGEALLSTEIPLVTRDLALGSGKF